MASMPPRPSEPLFLERQTYRRRRLMDAARLLPVVAAALILLPVLWAGPDQSEPARTAMGGLYVFVVWLLLILAAALMSRRLIQTDALRDPVPDAVSPEDEVQGQGARFGQTGAGQPGMGDGA